MPLDRSRAITLAHAGARLAAALAPPAAFGALSLLRADAALPAWINAGLTGLGAAVAAVALLVTVAAHLERGRLRDVGDAIGLGLLAVTLAGLAAAAVHPLGLGIGMAGASVAFGVASALAGARLKGRPRRWVGVVLAVVIVDAGAAAVLFAGDAGGDAGRFVMGGGALVIGVAATLTWREGGRATALGIAAGSLAALAMAGGSPIERIPGLAGAFAASGLLAWVMVERRWRPGAATPRLPSQTTLPEVRSRLQQIPESIAEPEYDEAARLTRELRATLDDLVAARRTIGLQRAEIERASTVDPLTGLSSRGSTLDRLRVDAAEGRRYAHPVTVVLIDIDGFAEMNHDYGLTVGDAVLREVALRLRLRIREADALGRVGGDSFLAILPHTDEGGAATFAQALLDRLVERSFSTDRGELTVSLSIGISLMRPGMTLSGEELLAAAEEALASAKAAGGNRIAFDRLHGLARLDERRAPSALAPDAVGDKQAGGQ